MVLPKSKYSGPSRGSARIPPELLLCRGCSQFVQPDVQTCPFCGGDVHALHQAHVEKLRATRDAVFHLHWLIDKAKNSENEPG